jgi:hypothetical protein
MAHLTLDVADVADVEGIADVEGVADVAQALAATQDALKY